MQTCPNCTGYGYAGYCVSFYMYDTKEQAVKATARRIKRDIANAKRVIDWLGNMVIRDRSIRSWRREAIHNLNQSILANLAKLDEGSIATQH